MTLIDEFLADRAGGWTKKPKKLIDANEFLETFKNGPTPTGEVQRKAIVNAMKEFGALKDSGSREEFKSGSVRDKQSGKGALELVPDWVIWLVSRVYEEGAKKYAARNWELGQPLSQYVRSAGNHLAKLKVGMRDEPHASQVIWNMIGYIFTAWLVKIGARPKELSDMPDQLNPITGSIAEPLSPFEYQSLETFFGHERSRDNIVPGK